MTPRTDSLSEPPLPLFAAAHPQASPPGARLPSYIADHRARLRDRFLNGGAEAMPDYELLEMVLFRANARTDMKPLARALLDRFGSFDAVITAPEPELLKIPRIGRAIVAELKLIEAAAQRLMRARVLNRPVLSSWQSLLDYCQTAMAHRDTEQFRILFLDRKNTLIADEPQAKGTVDHVPVYPREVVKRALELNASAMILVHNHPSGDPTPSQPDVDMTAQIVTAAGALGITVHDHLIIGKSCEYSFRANELI